ncbi:MAG: hypothetical protein HZB14_05165 [Actinobacteria bacterium]|nr:hypothetical protein [Actinomycetota bacterium]
MRRRSPQLGQALVETVASVPVLIVCAMLGMQGLAAGAAWLQADNAAHSAALAAQSGGDASRAARAALPGWSRGRVSVSARHGRIDVWLTPRALFPPLAGALRAHGLSRYTPVAR